MFITKHTAKNKVFCAFSKLYLNDFAEKRLQYAAKRLQYAAKQLQHVA